MKAQDDAKDSMRVELLSAIFHLPPFNNFLRPLCLSRWALLPLFLRQTLLFLQNSKGLGSTSESPISIGVRSGMTLKGLFRSSPLQDSLNGDIFTWEQKADHIVFTIEHLQADIKITSPPN